MSHCVVDLKAQPVVLRCLRCNGTAPFSLPMTVSQMAALTRQFEKEHKNCLLTSVGKG